MIKLLVMSVIFVVLHIGFQLSDVVTSGVEFWPNGHIAPVAVPDEVLRSFGWCDSSNPSKYDPRNITTPKAKELYGRKIELRYNKTDRCAWGKISNGSPGDEIWVDRSFDNGRTWQSKLGLTKINYGRTQYTMMFDDKKVKMRACGKAGNRAEVACTDWY